MNAPSPEVPPILVGRSITYELTRLDVFLASLTLLLRQWILAAWLGALFLFDLGARVLLRRGYETLPEIIVEVSVKFFWILLAIQVWIVLCGIFGAFVSRRKGVICEHTLGIRPEGLIERTQTNETLHPWTTVRSVTSLFGYVFIYVGWFNAHIVPKRRVAADVLEGFVAEVRVKREEAGS